MAVTPIAPTPGSPVVSHANTGRMPNLTKITPPKVTGKSWLGVDPTQTMNTATAKEGIEGYLGRSLTPEEIQKAVGISGYDDSTFTKDWTGEQYNKILAAGAGATGNTFTPWSTTDGSPAPTMTPPGTETTTGPAAPELTVPEYQRRGDFRFDTTALANDPGYQFRQQEAQRALAHQGAAAGNVRGGNFMRDLLQVSQGLASDEVDRAFNRATGTYDRNVADDRYAHESNVNRSQIEYAPRLLTWQRDRDDSQRNRELDFDRDWQREIYGRDDAWRRHVYANDDLWRRYELEEDRRRFLANGGNQ